jgi:hypothetical protein
MAAHILAGRERHVAVHPCSWPTVHLAAMRIVRDYFGLDRTTVTYDCDITGVGGDADCFYIVADLIQSGDRSGARTVVTLSHDEMARMLADYRQNSPIDEETLTALLAGPKRNERGFLATCRSSFDLFKSVVRLVARVRRRTRTTSAGSHRRTPWR